MDDDFETPLEEIPDQSKERELDELFGPPLYPEHPENDSSSFLYRMAAEDFEKALPFLIGGLRNRRNVRIRDAAVFLAGCHGQPEELGRHVLRALKMEAKCRRKVLVSVYAGCFIDLGGEEFVKPMLEIWNHPESDSYSKSVAAEFLARHLSESLA